MLLVADSRKNKKADTLVSEIDASEPGMVENGEAEHESFREVILENKDIDSLLRDHNDLAADMATDCAVLLKNEGVLPLNRGQKVLIVGELFEEMRYQGAGSSGICPQYLTSPKQAFDQAGEVYTYTQGYHASTHRVDEKLVEEVLREAETADVVLFFGGLTERFESEGFDRRDLSMPENQLKLLAQLCELYRGQTQEREQELFQGQHQKAFPELSGESEKKIVAVLFGGSPMELPFAETVDGILNMFLPGQNGGEAVRRIIYGEADPGGRLSETWMKICMDIPGGGSYGKKKIETYRENIFVGYRYFDRRPDRIRYPFGYGLSYTEFTYRDLQIHHESGVVTVTVTVTNTGDRDGAEVIQLYVGKNVNTAVFKADKELRAFAKVWLKAGESRAVTLQFAETDLSYYHTKLHQWITENGDYPILVGASSQDIRLSGVITLSGYEAVEAPYSPEVVAAYGNIGQNSILDDLFVETIGRPIPVEPKIYPFTIESPLGDYRLVPTSRWIYNLLIRGLEKNGDKYEKLPEGKERDALLKNQEFILNLIPKNCPR